MTAWHELALWGAAAWLAALVAALAAAALAVMGRRWLES